MRKILFYFVFAVILVVTACKKDTTSPSYMPRFLDAYSSSCIIYDTRDLKNVKRYDYNWNTSQNKFILAYTEDTTLLSNLRYWPAGVTDPVGAGYSLHFLDRANGNNTYEISYSDPLIDSTLTEEYPGFPSTWISPNKIDGYDLFYETYGASDGYAHMFFDFANGSYIYSHTSAIFVTGLITDLVKVPNGNMTSDPIDWTKADACFAFQDSRYVDENALIFLDYDEMKYVEITRKSNTAVEAGRQTLQTTAWHPISELFDVWKF